MKPTKKSQQLFDRACRVIPGGVNSPVRAFKSVDNSPLFITHAQGSRIYDADANSYIDYVCSWGANIVGHAHPEIVAAIADAATRGTSFGAPTEREILLAETICRLMPSIESVRMVNSGTEAAMSAIRLARAYTRRDKIIKFDGCYHGHSDALLAGAGSGVSTLDIPDSPGVPTATVGDTMVLEYNNVEQLETAIRQNTAQIACVIVEPIAGNMNLVKGTADFLGRLRELCTTHGIILIFDEVMSGFRVALGGAQTLLKISPDLTTLGKVIGGGLPVGAFGGTAEIMSLVAPAGSVYQAGTLSGNPIATAAGLKTLELIQADGFFEQLTYRSQKLCDGLQALADKHSAAFHTVACGGMFGLFFTQMPVVNLAQAKQADEAAFKFFHRHALEHGVYFAPSRFEAAFLSAAHTDTDVDAALVAAESAFMELTTDKHR